MNRLIARTPTAFIVAIKGPWQNTICRLLACIIISIHVSVLSVQADELFYGVSEDISNVSTVSSSKREEDVFSAPLSMSVVSGEQIKRAGILTVPEALKLVPGVIVREQTNGQFEVNIRGFDNVPTNGTMTTLSNRLTLVMIDNRTVYNYFDGGLFWETLPVDIDDIDRIEVIRGAASALYGPNAVNGVIHIITKRANSKALVEANIVAGNQNTQKVHLAAEQTIGKSHIRLSGFVDQRDRYQSTYYSFAEEQYLPFDQINFAPGLDNYPDPEQARDVKAITLTINNDPTEMLAYDISFSHQDSRIQKVHLNAAATPFTVNDSNTDAVNAKINYSGLQFRASHQWGSQETLGFSDFTYDLAISQASLEYEYRLPKWIIRPGISHENITYDGSFIGGEKTLRDTGYLLRTEYFPAPDYRFIVALRYDDYNTPSDGYFSYQVIGNYQLRHDTLLRASVQTANSSPFMLDSYLDFQFTRPNNTTQRLDFMGDKEGDLKTITTFELGMRHQFNFNNWFDIELFHSEVEDFTAVINKGTEFDGNQFVTTNQRETLPTEATQIGITVDWHYEEVDWDMNVYLTAQDTDVKDQFETRSDPLVLFDSDNKGTPDYYGGINTNWRPMERWNINANAYYMSSHTFVLQPTKGTKEFPSAVYANFTISHQFNNSVNGFVSAKNISNKNESQYFYTDNIDPLYVIGISLKWSE